MRLHPALRDHPLGRFTTVLGFSGAFEGLGYFTRAEIRRDVREGWSRAGQTPTYAESSWAWDVGVQGFFSLGALKALE